MRDLTYGHATVGDPQHIHDAVAIRVRCSQVGQVIRHGGHVSKANCPQ
jgi:hypothetical protein